MSRGRTFNWRKDGESNGSTGQIQDTGRLVHSYYRRPLPIPLIYIVLGRHLTEMNIPKSMNSHTSSRQIWCILSQQMENFTVFHHTIYRSISPDTEKTHYMYLDLPRVATIVWVTVHFIPLEVLGLRGAQPGWPRCGPPAQSHPRGDLRSPSHDHLPQSVSSTQRDETRGDPVNREMKEEGRGERKEGREKQERRKEGRKRAEGREKSENRKMWK